MSGFTRKDGANPPQGPVATATFALPHCTLALLCDGSGSPMDGESISALAVRLIHDEVLRLATEPPSTALERAIAAANFAIREFMARVGRPGGACSVVAVAVAGGRCTVAHVGDARATLVRRGSTTAITRDHTAANLFVDAGLLSEADAIVHPEGRELSRSVGVAPQVDVACTELDVEPGDVLVLTPSSVHGRLTEGGAIPRDASQATRRLLELVRDRDSNSAVVVLRVDERTDEVTSTALPPLPAAPGHTPFVYDTVRSEWCALLSLQADTADENELRRLMSLDHPNLLRTLAFRRFEDELLVVTELARGGNAAERVDRRGPLPGRVAATVVLDVCGAVELLVANGFGNRSLFPENIHLFPDGTVKLSIHGALVGAEGSAERSVVGILAALVRGKETALAELIASWTASSDVPLSVWARRLREVLDRLPPTRSHAPPLFAAAREPELQLQQRSDGVHVASWNRQPSRVSVLGFEPSESTVATHRSVVSLDPGEEWQPLLPRGPVPRFLALRTLTLHSGDAPPQVPVLLVSLTVEEDRWVRGALPPGICARRCTFDSARIARSGAPIVIVPFRPDTFDAVVLLAGGLDQTVIIALADEVEPNAVLEALRGGLGDYVVVHRDRDPLCRTVSKVLNRCWPRPPSLVGQDRGSADAIQRYRAWDRIAGRWAILEVRQRTFESTTTRGRFERTALAHLSLRHPNVLRVYAAGGQADDLILVTEPASARTLADWCAAHGAMPPRMAVGVALDVCAGVHYLHEEGVIHRDLQPRHVFLDGSGTCKVGGLGVAQIVAEAERLTFTGEVLGTIPYMAPEQFETAKHADERADVYGIAALLYSLLHGQPASHLFMAEDRDFERCPPSLAEVIRKGSQYRREARYPTVSEMGRDLAGAVTSLGPVPPATPWLGIDEDVSVVDVSRGARIRGTPSGLEIALARAHTGWIDVMFVGEPQPGANVWRETPIRRERRHLEHRAGWQPIVTERLGEARYVGILPATDPPEFSR